MQKKWLNNIHKDGFLEVKMKFIEHTNDGYFKFHFIHSVTKKIATLETHGFTEKEYNDFVFKPRAYWNGLSTADPKIEDWLTDDFKYRIEYYK